MAHRDGHQVTAGVGVGVQDHQGATPHPQDPVVDRWRTAGRRCGRTRSARGRRLRRRATRRPAYRTTAPTTYALRQPAHRRSRVTAAPHAAVGVVDRLGQGPIGDLVEQGDREVGQRHPAVGAVAPPPVHAHGAGGHVVVAHHQDVRDLEQLGPTDAGAEGLGGRIHLDPDPPGAEPVGDLVDIGLVVVAHPEDPDLLGSQPCRKRPGVVLDQDGEEPLDRAEQGPVEHDRPVPGVVGPHVLQAETLRMVEVALDGAELPGPADGVTHVDVDLRAVEGGVALLDLVGQAVASRGRAGVPRWPPPRCRRSPRTCPGPWSTGWR